MLDHDHGQPAFELLCKSQETLHTVGAKPRSRLVEAEHARLLRQRHRDLERAAVAIGQFLRADIGLVGKPHVGQHPFGFRLEILVAGGRAAHIETALAELRQRDHHIVARGEFVEQGHDLE